jgi:hypothetical protein
VILEPVIAHVRLDPTVVQTERLNSYVLVSINPNKKRQPSHESNKGTALCSHHARIRATTNPGCLAATWPFMCICPEAAVRHHANIPLDTGVLKGFRKGN